MSWRIEHGDCLDVMRGMEAGSVDAIVTDPPYGLAFMGREWDHGVPGVPFWSEALRVAKLGAHLLAFGGTRTYHRLTCAIEDAGWEIRDCIMWVYGSGFPKSLDVSKAIDKVAGAEREVVGFRSPFPPDHARPNKDLGRLAAKRGRRAEQLGGLGSGMSADGVPVTAPATDAARRWQGFGTALKPAYEPIIVARKPLDGTVAANVLRHGTGAINVDGCRVGTRAGNESGWSKTGSKASLNRSMSGANYDRDAKDESGVGRWPANIIHDGSDEVVAGFPETASGAWPATGAQFGYSGGQHQQRGHRTELFDAGSAARFFYCAKASKSDRGEGNTHPTVKPSSLMRYLCRLVTPPGGTVLDPFCGSGSTGKAATAEGFGFIGIEREADYVTIAERRIAESAAQTLPDLPLFAASGN